MNRKTILFYFIVQENFVPRMFFDPQNRPSSKLAMSHSVNFQHSKTSYRSFCSPAKATLTSVCPTYTVQHFDFTTFPLLFIIMGIINKRKSPTPHASKENRENN